MQQKCRRNHGIKGVLFAFDMPDMTLVRKIPLFMLALAALYVGWVFFSRWSENRTAEQAAEAARARDNAKIVEMYGSGELKILNFYTTADTIRHGGKTLLCYGVSNAAAVRIEPGVEPLRPSLSRCVEVTPRQDTQYTLTAEDAAGHRSTATLVVRVK
jgi:hypothetical protein